MLIRVSEAARTLEEWVERGVAPYVGRLDREALDELRALLRDSLSAHPGLERLARAQETRAPVTRSEELPTGAARAGDGEEPTDTRRKHG